MLPLESAPMDDYEEIFSSELLFIIFLTRYFSAHLVEVVTNKLRKPVYFHNILSLFQ